MIHYFNLPLHPLTGTIVLFLTKHYQLRRQFLTILLLDNGISNQVTAVVVSGSTVELTLANTIKNDEVVSLTYTDPTAGDDSKAIQDSAGNDVSLSTNANNSTVPGSAPFITSTYVS